MNVILYAKDLNGKGRELKLACNSLVSEPKTEVFNSMGDLLSRLLTISPGDAVVILMAKSRDELTALQPALHMFRRVKLILLLPDQKPETIKIGYKLEPRFLYYIDSGIEVIKDILRKILYNPKFPDGKNIQEWEVET